MTSNEKKLDKKHVDKIVDHMNHDHKDALSYYIKYYLKQDTLPEDVRLLSIDNTGLNLTHKRKNDLKAGMMRIPFGEPVINITELRQTLNVMLLVSYKGLGLSPHQVTQYRFSLGQASMLGITLYLFGTLITNVNITGLEPLIRGLFPEAYRTSAALSIPLINLSQFAVLMRPLLIRYRVPGRQWWAWSFASVTCGFPAIIKLQQMGEEGEPSGVL